jgi:hypothetical protein
MYTGCIVFVENKKAGIGFRHHRGAFRFSGMHIIGIPWQIDAEPLANDLII